MTTTCVWCGNKGKKTFHARVCWEKLDSSWYRCGACDSLMILPRPSKKQIAEVYENDYRGKRLQPHVGVDNRTRYAKEYRPTVYAEYELSLRDLAIEKKGVKSILDFGCADGVFLEFCKTYFNQDTKLYGTDLSENMLGDARKNGWNVVSLGDLDTLKTKFDLITLWDVIEHVEEPAAVIKTLQKFLTPKGKIVIETPRFGVLGELRGEQWPHLLPVQHLSLASKEGMQKFAKRMRLTIHRYASFGANAPSSAVAEPYKKLFDTLAKKLDFGDVQILSLKARPRAT
jgi:2-polyprenyl-3-methyl-5-hydroxy-6-metoxy-1,4-benzoquinol methylase